MFTPSRNENIQCDDIHTLYTRETSVKRIKEKKTGIAIRSIDSQGEKL